MLPRCHAVIAVGLERLRIQLPSASLGISASLLRNIKAYGYSDDELVQYRTSIEAFVGDGEVAGELLQQWQRLRAARRPAAAYSWSRPTPGNPVASCYRDDHAIEETTMKTSTPIRIDAELYAAATGAAAIMSRSTTQQIAHWARIGRELEASPEISIEHVVQVLRGAKDYDALRTEEQAVVRAYWAEKMATLAAALRLDQKFAAEGRPYVELDDSGAVVRHDPEPRPAASRSTEG